MNYREWNERLADHFFNPTHAGRRVYLHTTTELLEQLAGKGAEADFVAAVKTGPSGTYGSLCRRAHLAFQRWDRSGVPPYLAHLCLFSLAAGREGEWMPHTYYARVWDLIGVDGQGTLPDFDDMDDLWNDLEKWSQVDLADSRGRFKAQIAGRRRHVGLPIAQTILSEGEHRALPGIFEAADLEPGANLPQEEVAGAVMRHGAYVLRRPTMQHLEGPKSSEYRIELASLLQAELVEWDGKTAAPARDRAEPQRAGLRIWLRDIDPAGFITSHLVARIPGKGDISELLFTDRNGSQYVCPAGTGAVSGALQRRDDGTEVDAASFSWTDRIELKSEEPILRLVLPKADVRVFVDGSDESMHGFLEARAVPASGPFMIAVRAAAAARIEKWGRECCSAWNTVPAASGLPPDWKLFSGTDARGDGGLSAQYHIFERPASPRIRFEGGISSGRSKYFLFALPRIRVDWSERPVSVTCDGTALECGDHGSYVIPPGIVKPVNRIHAAFTGREADEYLYVVSDGWTWGDGTACLPANGYGLAPGPGDPELRGADVRNVEAPEFSWDPGTGATRSLRGIWIGRIAGQIADLRSGGREPDWPPVWIVTGRRGRFSFSYCGFNIGEEDATAAPAPGSSVKKWRAVVWGARRRTAPPADARQARLFQQYREVARAL